MIARIHLGFEVGSGDIVDVPIRHTAVTGQTQESGKTTTLEALVMRSGLTALTFVTKRGEGSFAGGRRVQPYFRDRADWQFVTSIIDATLQEKNKFLRPWIMKICRTTRTLAEVQNRIREALRSAKGIHEGVYTQLDAYLELIVPEIRRAALAKTLELAPGLNVMDVGGFAAPMQMLFIQSALDWVNEHCHKTIVVIPEAWEFVPEGKGSPVKASAIALVRKGAALGNFIWLDSQDMAGVDKTLLRGCAVWLIGVQREANEIKRNLQNIPAGIKRPNAGDVALLERGQFFACFGKAVIKTYVQPAWMGNEDARNIAEGAMTIEDAAALVPNEVKPKEVKVNEKEATELRYANDRLRRDNELLTDRVKDIPALENKVRDLQKVISDLTGGDRLQVHNNGEVAKIHGTELPDMDAIYAEVKRRAQNDPGVLRILTSKPEIEVTVTRRTIQMDGSDYKSRIAKMLADGFYNDGKTNGQTRTELKRTGKDMDNRSIGRYLDELVSYGFMVRSANAYVAVPDMKVNVIER